MMFDLDKKKEAVKYMQKLAGEDSTIVDNFDAIICRAPTKKSMYEMYQKQDGDAELVFEDKYQIVRDTSGNYWQLQIKKGSTWINM